MNKIQQCVSLDMDVVMELRTELKGRISSTINKLLREYLGLEMPEDISERKLDTSINKLSAELSQLKLQKEELTKEKEKEDKNIQWLPKT